MIVDKRARRFIISNLRSEDSEGTWRVDDTFVVQTADEEIFDDDLQFLEKHDTIVEVIHSGNHFSHFEIEFRWLR